MCRSCRPMLTSSGLLEDGCSLIVPYTGQGMGVCMVVIGIEKSRMPACLQNPFSFLRGSQCSAVCLFVEKGGENRSRCTAQIPPNDAMFAFSLAVRCCNCVIFGSASGPGLSEATVGIKDVWVFPGARGENRVCPMRRWRESGHVFDTWALTPVDGSQ